MSDIDIPNSSSVEAVVNNPPKALKTLYHPTLKTSVETTEENLSALFALGFRLKDFDPEVSLAECLAVLKSVEGAVIRYARGVIDDGVIDRSDVSAQVAAFVSVDAFAYALRELQIALEAKYPRAEAAPAIMAREVEKEGKTITEEIQVDPNQVDAFKAEGWAEA